MKFGNMSIRTKLTFPYVILSLIIAIAGSYLITNFVVGSIEKRFVNTLIETGKIVADMVVQQENQQLDSLRLISFIDGLPELITSGDSEEIREMILPIIVNYNIEVVEILNTSGKSIISIRKDSSGDVGSYNFIKGEDPFSGLIFISNILNSKSDEKGDIFVEVVKLSDIEYLFVSGPVYDDDGEIIGVVLIGHSLKRMLREIKSETLAQITIYEYDGQAKESTFLSTNPINPENVMSIPVFQEESSYLRDFTLSDIFYSELVYVWELRNHEDEGLIGVAMAKDFLVETSQTTSTNIIMFVFVIFIFILMIGLYLAKHLTTPIFKLRDAAINVSKGDLSVRVDPSGEDEVAQLTKSFNEMIRNLKQSKDELLIAYERTLEGWSKALELRDGDTQGHTQRVTDMTVAIAVKKGIKDVELENIRRGALLHDIGKVGVPDAILRKPGKLTDEEFAIMKKHPDYGKEMLSKIPFLIPAMDIPYCHHEKWNGLGYPKGLVGEEIPYSARIFALVDVWDAITSDRPYRKAMQFEEALQIIEKGRGTHFDPELTDDFINYIKEQLKIK